jgi:thymidylate synthase (FAD)
MPDTIGEKMTTKLISITPDAEKTMLYVARVSSPKQESSNTGLLGYCLKHKHWSVFEHAVMTIEIETSRAISPQILRHRSFTFSEFSQRYATVEDDPVLVDARRQDDKNRQNSTDDMDQYTKDWWTDSQYIIWEEAMRRYEQALAKGIAKEVARNILPVMAPTKIYMTGSVRSWLHYIQLRSAKETQLEHRIIAEGCRDIFTEQLPIIAEALGWQ